MVKKKKKPVKKKEEKEVDVSEVQAWEKGEEAYTDTTIAAKEIAGTSICKYNFIIQNTASMFFHWIFFTTV